MKLLKWFKKLRAIVKDYDHLAAQVEANKGRTQYAVDLADEARSLIKKRTSVHADIHTNRRASNYFIAIGHNWIQQRNPHRHQ